MPSFSCPVCAVMLEKVDSGIGVLWACPKCQGRAVTVAVLRRNVNKTFMNQLWQDVRTAPVAHAHGIRNCPSCQKPMLEVAIGGVSGDVEIDACRLCQFLWFDANETAQLPITPVTSKEVKPSLPPTAAEAIALARIKSIRDQADREDNIRRAGDLWDWWVLADLVRYAGLWWRR